MAAKGTLLYKGTIRDYDAALDFGERGIALAEATKDLALGPLPLAARR